MSFLSAMALALGLAAGTGDMGIREVKAAHEQQLLNIDGVVSVGIGLADDGAESIVIGIERDDESFRKQLPETLEGYRVLLKQVGQIKTQ